MQKTMLGWIEAADARMAVQGTIRQPPRCFNPRTGAAVAALVSMLACLGSVISGGYGVL